MIKVNQFLFFLLLLTFLKNPAYNIGVTLSIADLLIALILLTSFIKIGATYYYPDDVTKISIKDDATQPPQIVRHNVSVIKITFTKKLRRNVRRVIKKFGLIYISLFGWFLIVIIYSFLLGNDYHQIFGRFRNLFVYPLLFFPGVLVCQNSRDVNRYLSLIKLFIFISIIVGTIHIIRPIPFLINPRIETNQGYHMILNQRIGLISILVFIHACMSYFLKRNTIESILIVIACVFAAIGSQNRSILICYVLAIIFICFFVLRERSVWFRYLKIAIVFVVVAVSSLFILMHSQYWERFERRYTKIVTEILGKSEFSQGERRIGRTMAALRHWTQSPIMGTGWGSHVNEYVIYDFEGNYIETKYGTPHNYYAAILNQTGLIGFLIIMCLFYKIYKTIKPKKRLSKERILEYSFLIFFLTCLVFNAANVCMYGLVTYISVIYFIFGLAVANSCMNNRIA